MLEFMIHSAELGILESFRYSGKTLECGSYIMFLHPDIERDLRGRWIALYGGSKRLQRSSKARKIKRKLMTSFRWG